MGIYFTPKTGYYYEEIMLYTTVICLLPPAAPSILPQHRSACRMDTTVSAIGLAAYSCHHSRRASVSNKAELVEILDKLKAAQLSMRYFFQTRVLVATWLYQSTSRTL